MDNELVSEIMRSLGRIEQKIDGQATWLAAHVEDDKKLTEAVQQIRSVQDRQKGAARVWNYVGTAAGAVVGSIVAILGPKFFNGGH